MVITPALKIPAPIGTMRRPNSDCPFSESWRKCWIGCHTLPGLNLQLWGDPFLNGVRDRVAHLIEAEPYRAIRVVSRGYVSVDVARHRRIVSEKS